MNESERVQYDVNTMFWLATSCYKLTSWRAERAFFGHKAAYFAAKRLTTSGEVARGPSSRAIWNPTKYFFESLIGYLSRQDAQDFPCWSCNKNSALFRHYNESFIDQQWGTKVLRHFYKIAHFCLMDLSIPSPCVPPHLPLKSVL